MCREKEKETLTTVPLHYDFSGGRDTYEVPVPGVTDTRSKQSAAF